MEEESFSRSADVAGTIFSIILILISIEKVFIDGILAKVVTKIILGLSGAVAALIYYQRVSRLEQTSDTPVGDTLIILAGFTIASINIIPLLKIEVILPSISLAIILLVSGIISKLFLLDRFLGFIISGIVNLIDMLIVWVTKSKLNYLKISSWIAAVILLVIDNISRILWIWFFFFTLLSVPFLIDVVITNKNENPKVLRIGLLIFATFSFFFGLSQEDLDLKIGIIMFSLVLTVWSIGRSRLEIAIMYIVDRIRNTIDYIRNNPLRSIRLIIWIGVIVLLIQGFVFYAILVTIINLLLPRFHRLRKMMDNILAWSKKNPRYSVQITLFFLSVVAIIFLPRRNQLHLYTSAGLFILSIAPSIVLGLKDFLSAFFSFFRGLFRSFIKIPRWIYNRFKTNLRLSLQVTSLFFSLLSYLFLPSEKMINIYIGILFLTLGIAPTLLNWLFKAIQELFSIFQDILTDFVNFVRSYPVKLFQFVSILTGTLLYILSREKTSLTLYFSASLVVLGILPSLYNGTKILLVYLVNHIPEWYNYLVDHPRRVYQIFFVSLSGISFIFLSDQTFTSTYSYRLFFGFTFILIALLPTLFGFIGTIIPEISNLFRSIGQSLLDLLNNHNFIYFLISIEGTISLMIIPVHILAVRIPLLIITTLAYLLLGNQFLVTLYDNIVSMLFYGISVLTRIMKRILPTFELGPIISFLSYIVFTIALFFRAFFGEIDNIVSIRWLLIFVAFLMWNLSYDKRREKFLGFITSAAKGIYYRISSIVVWIFRNTWILLLFVIGLGFLVISLGLIIPGTISLVSTIFSTVIPNRLISWIIGSFMFAIGLFTIQQAISRREQIRIDIKGDKRK